MLVWYLLILGFVGVMYKVGICDGYPFDVINIQGGLLSSFLYV